MIEKGRAIQLADTVLRVGDRVEVAGGNSTFHAVDANREYLVKEFAEPVVGAEAERLGRLVDRTANLVKDARVPVRSVAWPQALLKSTTGAVEAVVIQRAPRSFYRPNQNALFEPVQNLAHLFSARPPLPDLRLRLTVAYNLAAALDVIEFQTLYHGDVSHGNVLWSANGNIFLIDCDGIRVQGEHSGHRGTPAWVDPRLSRREIGSHDVHSDRYALALLIARAYAGGRFDFDPASDGLRGDIPAPIRRRLEMIFKGDLGSRLRPREWMPILANAIQSLPTIGPSWTAVTGEPMGSADPAAGAALAEFLAGTGSPLQSPQPNVPDHLRDATFEEVMEALSGWDSPPPMVQTPSPDVPDHLRDATVEEVHEAMSTWRPPRSPPRKRKKRSGRRR